MTVRETITVGAILAVGLLLFCCQSARADIISDLENHYSFADSANPFVDDSIPARDGTNSGAVWVNDPMLGGVAEFSSGDYVSAPIPDLNTTGEFTVALWANLPTIATANPGFFQVQNGGTTPSGVGKVLGGWVDASSPRFALPRIDVRPDAGVAVLAAEISGLLPCLRRIRGGA